MWLVVPDLGSVLTPPEGELAAARAQSLPETDGAQIRELRRLVYSRTAALDPVTAAANRALLDDLEARRSIVAQFSNGVDDSLTAPATSGATDGASPNASKNEREVEQGGEREHDSAPASFWRSRRVVAVIACCATLMVVSTAVAAVIASTAKTSPSSLTIFDRRGVLGNQQPLPADFAIGISPSATIETLRGLGTFEGWSVWAARLGDARICLIATHDSLRGATCSKPAEFATTGLSLRIAGPSAVPGNAAPVRDLSITWGPDDEQPTTVDAPR